MKKVVGAVVAVIVALGVIGFVIASRQFENENVLFRS